MSHKRRLIVTATLLSLSIAAGGAYAEQSQTPMPGSLLGPELVGGSMMGQGTGSQDKMAQETQ